MDFQDLNDEEFHKCRFDFRVALSKYFTENKIQLKDMLYLLGDSYVSLGKSLEMPKEDLHRTFMLFLGEYYNKHD